MGILIDEVVYGEGERDLVHISPLLAAVPDFFLALSYHVLQARVALPRLSNIQKSQMVDKGACVREPCVTNPAPPAVLARTRHHFWLPWTLLLYLHPQTAAKLLCVARHGKGHAAEQPRPAATPGPPWPIHPFQKPLDKCSYMPFLFDLCH
jgi:hypothetical protein